MRIKTQVQKTVALLLVLFLLPVFPAAAGQAEPETLFTVSGKITAEADGTALEDVGIQLFAAGEEDEEDVEPVSTAVSAEDGLYYCHNIAPGNYVMKISAGEYNGAYYAEPEIPVTVTVTDKHEDLPVALKYANAPGTHSVSGRVVDASDTGVPGVPVRLLRSNKPVGSAVTGNDGGFVIYSIPASAVRYILSAAPGRFGGTLYGGASAEITVPDANPVSLKVAEMASSYTISGTVTANTPGSPPLAAALQLRNRGGPVGYPVPARREDGGYEIDLVPPADDYYIDVTMPGYTGGVIGPISIDDHSEASQNIALTPIPLVAPEITSRNSTEALFGQTGYFQVTATGTAPLRYGLVGAPDGVTIDSFGKITVAATVPAETYTFTVRAENGAENGSAGQEFTLKVVETAQKPVFTSEMSYSIYYGQRGSYQITADGTRPMSFSLAASEPGGSVPAGVSIHPRTGVLTVTPNLALANVYDFLVVAHNGVGNGTSEPFTLTVKSKIPVTLNGVSADGESGKSDTAYLELAFDRDITGLLPSHIQIVAGTGRVTAADSLTNPETGVYRLAVTDVKEGSVTVIVRPPEDYTITDNFRQVDVFQAIPKIPVTVTANGKINTETTTQLTIAFDFPEAVELDTSQITLTGKDGSAVKGALHPGETSNVFLLDVDYVRAGTVDIAIADGAGYEITGSPFSTGVLLHRRIETIKVESVTANGAANRETTTKLTFRFDKAITLALSDITILQGSPGSAVKGSLSGNGNVWELTVNNVSQGTVTAVISDPEGYNITNRQHMVPVYENTLKEIAFAAATANGSAAETTSAITLIFSDAVPGLSGSHILISGAGSATKGALTASGITYTLQVSGVTAGEAVITVNAPEGYRVSGEHKVTLYRAAAPVTLLSAVADGTAGSATSTKITLTFSADITGLTADSITLTDGTGKAVKGAFSGSGKTYELAVSGVVAGTVSVAVSPLPGYELSGSPKETALHKAASITGGKADPVNLTAAGGSVTYTVSGTDIPSGIRVKVRDTEISGTTVGSGTATSITVILPANPGNTAKTYSIGYSTDGTNYQYDATVTVAAGVRYNIIDSAGKTVTSLPEYTGKQNYIIRSNGDYAKFYSDGKVVGAVKIDGKTLLAGTNYTHKSGSTEITLLSTYMDTLSNGTHTADIVFTDGTATQSFTVNWDGAGGLPATGDTNRLVFWIMLLALALAGGGLVIVLYIRSERKKKK